MRSKVLDPLELHHGKKPCADQLTATIFCQRPMGHAGPHAQRWTASDPIAMWTEKRDAHADRWKRDGDDTDIVPVRAQPVESDWPEDD